MIGDEKNLGLYRKFDVVRVDESPKHKDCEYFVLDRTHDPFALPALIAYAKACRSTYPALADDLENLVIPQLKARLEAPKGKCPTCEGSGRHLDGAVCTTCQGMGEI